MEERQVITTERRRAYPYEVTDIGPELFEDMIRSLENMSLEGKRKWLQRWDRAAFYTQGVGSHSIVEYRKDLKPVTLVSSITEMAEKQAGISLFYRSGIFASVTLTLSAVGATVSDIIATDLGVPIALSLFGIFLAFSIEAIRFRKRTRRLA